MSYCNQTPFPPREGWGLGTRLPYAKRTHKAKEHQELIFKSKKNPKAFWKYFNNLGVCAKSKLPASVIDSCGNEVKQPEDVVNCWGEYFRTLFLEEPSAVGQPPSQLDIPLTHQNPVDASELNVHIYPMRRLKQQYWTVLKITKLQEQIT